MWDAKAEAEQKIKKQLLEAEKQKREIITKQKEALRLPFLLLHGQTPTCGNIQNHLSKLFLTRSHCSPTLETADIAQSLW